MIKQLDAGLAFGLETLDADLLAELTPILEDQATELAPFNLKPDTSGKVFLQLQTMGVLRVFTMRRLDRLVGFAAFIVGPSSHFLNCKEANQDLLYIIPALRMGLNGPSFLKWCDKRLAEEGVDIVYHHTKHHADFGALLERLGYKPIDHIYARRLTCAPV